MAAQNHLLIVWHSRTGASEQLARAALNGAQSAQARVVCVRCDQVSEQQMLDSQSYLFVCPENLASMSGLMKEFFDRMYYPMLEQLNGRAYAVIISAGSDGHGAATQLARIATGWRMRAIAEPMIVAMDAQTPEAILAPKHVADQSLVKAREMGEAMASAAMLGIY